MERIIDEKTGEQLKEKFKTELKDSVEVLLFTSKIISPENPQQGDINNFARQLVREIAAIEPKVKFKELPLNDSAAKDAGIVTSPSLMIGRDKGYGIVYNGAPLGHEATGFIETISIVSRGEALLGEEDEKLLSGMKNKTNVKVFVTPTCPYCPKASILANRIAVASKGKVVAETVEAAENQELAQKFNVSSVPQQVVNDDPETITVGVQPERVLIDQAMSYGDPEKYTKIKEEKEKMKAEKEKLVDNPEGVIYITDKNIAEALKKYPNLVVDCWAEWCMPCKMLAPTIEELAKAQKGEVVYGKLNVDENQKTAMEHKIMSIPTVVVFKNGERKGDIVGVQPKEQMLKQVNDILKG